MSRSLDFNEGKEVVGTNIGTGMQDQPSAHSGQPVQDLYVKIVRAWKLVAKDEGGTNSPVSASTSIAHGN